jgi:hypothetical protein
MSKTSMTRYNPSLPHHHGDGVSYWQIADNGNHWTVIGGYYVRVFQRNSGGGWGALFKRHGAPKGDEPNWIQGTFSTETGQN